MTDARIIRIIILEYMKVLIGC